MWGTAFGPMEAAMDYYFHIIPVWCVGTYLATAGVCMVCGIGIGWILARDL
jgi:hypothetical protein